MFQAAAFVQEYQQVTPLTIGELWAIPIMLRIGILERLVYACSELTGLEAPKSLSPMPNRDLPRPVQEPGLTQESTNQFASPALPNDAIVSNCFLSLRLLSATDWKNFFEQTSRVERILRDDPAGVYAGMDFDTRNNYRTVIEEVARNSGFSEEEVALAAIDFARGEFGSDPIVETPVTAKENTVQAPAGDIQPGILNKSHGRKGHVGYFLVDAGRAQLEKRLNCRLA
jgi:hypothetical protein